MEGLEQGNRRPVAGYGWLLLTVQVKDRGNDHENYKYRGGKQPRRGDQQQRSSDHQLVSNPVPAPIRLGPFSPQRLCGQLLRNPEILVPFEAWDDDLKFNLQAGRESRRGLLGNRLDSRYAGGWVASKNFMAPT